jgi:hypothetical protein
MFTEKFTPMDKDSMQLICAMRLIKQMEDGEIAKLPKTGKNAEIKYAAIKDKYRAKEIAVLRRASGPFIVLIEGPDA